MSGITQLSPKGVAARVYKGIPQREFITGIREGRDGGNSFYNICRVNVPLTRFKKECVVGIHPYYLTHRVSTAWRCPAHARRNAPSPASLEKYKAEWPKLPPPAHAMELVHSTLVQPEWLEPTCVICRFRVPRERLVKEVKLGLHPGFRVFTRNGVEYVKGLESLDFLSNNVNYKSSCDFCVVRKGYWWTTGQANLETGAQI